MSLHFCLDHIMKHYVQFALYRLNHNKTMQLEALFTIVWLTVLFYCCYVVSLPGVDMESYSTPGKIFMNYTVYLEISTCLII